MRLQALVWRLLLLPLLVLPCNICSACPKACTCYIPQSIFCIQRRSSSIPLNLPASTKDLYVFQNGITSLRRQDFLGLVELQMLDLSQNALTEIPDGVFRSLTSLHNLDLSSNYITHLSKDSFAGLVNLERLYLHSNLIQSIHPAAFKNLEYLLELKLQGNKISILPALHLPKLLLLDISYNSIPAPGSADLQTPHLESLKMAGLGLTTLDEGLMRSLGNLHDLDVSINKLSRIPLSLRSVKGLIRLNLSSNSLGLLRQEDFQNLVGLQELDISNLNLQGFPVGFFQMFPRLHHLTAAENPFNCLCPLAWFSSWLKEKKVELGRKDVTRCHFPPLNSGRMLAELENKDFGCPTTTTELSDVLTISSTHKPPDPTTALGTTHAFPPLPPSDEPSVETDSHLSPEATASPRSHEEHEEHMCPPNICLNGGICRFDQQGQVDCLCQPGRSGTYCEDWDEPQPPPLSPKNDVVPTVSMLDSISSHHVTSTSITLDLHRYIESRPHIRGIRLVYRNLSGPDRRPLQLNVPPTYPEYTLRGLHPNCTYSVCASPLGEPAEHTKSSCMETQTAGILTSSHQPSVNKSEPSSTLVPILVAVAVVMAVAIIAAVVVVSRRRRVKSPADMDLDEPAPFELEGVKTCLENGATPKKHPEIMPCPPVSQNGMEYEIPLIQQQFIANNNTDGRIPSYIKMQKYAAQTSSP
ncbi:vasorin a isoform X2 [Pygocentrus nattereri]|uniref:EGF-like domain-containing protein n=2 Tax=Pygocentrus nattereri TaxID=42514 RepID=A0A3B4CRW9_PYGNA|nr:vasorin a isoform X2 [Pygocentrus nattereri]